MGLTLAIMLGHTVGKSEEEVLNTITQNPQDMHNRLTEFFGQGAHNRKWDSLQCV